MAQAHIHPKIMFVRATKTAVGDPDKYLVAMKLVSEGSSLDNTSTWGAFVDSEADAFRSRIHDRRVQSCQIPSVTTISMHVSYNEGKSRTIEEKTEAVKQDRKVAAWKGIIYPKVRSPSSSARGGGVDAFISPIS